MKKTIVQREREKYESFLLEIFSRSRLNDCGGPTLAAQCLELQSRSCFGRWLSMRVSYESLNLPTLKSNWSSRPQLLSDFVLVSAMRMFFFMRMDMRIDAHGHAH